MAFGISFLSENLSNEALITMLTGTENGQFPLVNIVNDASAVKFRSIENSIVIQFDLQQTRNIDTIALHGDTNDTLGMTDASVRTSLTTDFSGSVVTPIPLSAEHLMGYEYLTTPVSHRYVELTLTGTGVYVELSNIFIGERIELLQQNLAISSFDYGFTDLSAQSSNRYGQKFLDKRNKLKFISGDIEHCILSEQETLGDMFVYHGKSLPIWMIVDKDSAGMTEGNYKLTIYGYFDKTPKWKAGGGQTWNTSLTINQAG